MTRNKFEKSGEDWLKKNRIPFGYETVKVPYTLTKSYIPDFSIGGPSTAPYMHIEFKGYMRASDQVKMRAVKRCNPGIDVRIVFQDASLKIRKGSQLSYGDWATKNGFIWSEGKIPRKWFK